MQWAEMWLGSHFDRVLDWVAGSVWRMLGAVSKDILINVKGVSGTSSV